jgi:hypothetical protein
MVISKILPAVVSTPILKDNNVWRNDCFDCPKVMLLEACFKAVDDLSLDKILYGSEINSLRDILRPAFCYEFVPCSISCGFGLACSLGWFALVGTC